MPPASDPTRRFSNRVENYIRYRPHYPIAVIDCLKNEFGLSPAHVVADIGSGTGILTELLLIHGNTVYGVEPNAEMRVAAERLLREHPGFVSINGTAEETTLADGGMDWITAGQAFHWFDVDRARLEFARILRNSPLPRVALLWNNRREDSPLLQAYEEFLREFGTDYADVKHQAVESDGRLERFFGAGGFSTRTFPNTQVFDFDGIRGRTLSASYMPAEDDAQYPAMLTALKRLFDRHAVGGRVNFEYDTRVFVGGLFP